LAALQRGGWQIVRVQGSHHHLRRPTGGSLVTVPVHAGKTLPPGTLGNFLKQTGLSADQLKDLL
jgi:predicted RNA binding protein YcfA (HicA-like mRNA interferase family)